MVWKRWITALGLLGVLLHAGLLVQHGNPRVPIAYPAAVGAERMLAGALSALDDQVICGPGAAKKAGSEHTAGAENPAGAKGPRHQPDQNNHCPACNAAGAAFILTNDGGDPFVPIAPRGCRARPSVHSYAHSEARLLPPSRGPPAVLA